MVAHVHTVKTERSLANSPNYTHYRDGRAGPQKSDAPLRWPVAEPQLPGMAARHNFGQAYSLAKKDTAFPPTVSFFWYLFIVIVDCTKVAVALAPTPPPLGYANCTRKLVHKWNTATYNLSRQTVVAGLPLNTYERR